MKAIENDDGYPRPQMVRDNWFSLDGYWDFCFDDDGRYKYPSDIPNWTHKIKVPFAPECPASEIADQGFHQNFWYKRNFTAPELRNGERLILHFGAVDYVANVWVNGIHVANHCGGYTPFSVDITDSLVTGVQCLVVCAEDDPADLAKPRGKQDWQLNPHSIWYPRTSGIWQPVWAEKVPAVSISKLYWKPNLQRWEIALEAFVSGPGSQNYELEVELSVEGRLLARDRYLLIGRNVTRRIALHDPGIDDYRNELLWSTRRPTLIDAEIKLLDEHGNVIDKVSSYTALRSISIHGDRFLLNGRPLRLRLVLDQGIWPETGLTPPDDAALKADIMLVKQMGFNGVRKHQKIEDPRYLYWADRLGLMVWAEMPSAYRFTRTSVHRLIDEWINVLERDASHPCIVAWVPFNESWGVPDLPNVAEHRHYVQTLYYLTKTFEPERPVVGNDGWESVSTDIITIHDYDENAERVKRRYASDETLPNLFKSILPAGRVVSLMDNTFPNQPIMLTEFGGISFSDKEGDWGYTRARSADEFAQLVSQIITAVRSISLFAGYCYTQFTDTYQETNGLLFADRTPKIPIEQIRAIVSGPITDSEACYEDVS